MSLVGSVSLLNEPGGSSRPRASPDAAGSAGIPLAPSLPTSKGGLSSGLCTPRGCEPELHPCSASPWGCQVLSCSSSAGRNPSQAAFLPETWLRFGLFIFTADICAFPDCHLKSIKITGMVFPAFPLFQVGISTQGRGLFLK